MNDVFVTNSPQLSRHLLAQQHRQLPNLFLSREQLAVTQRDVGPQDLDLSVLTFEDFIQLRHRLAHLLVALPLLLQLVNQRADLLSQPRELRLILSSSSPTSSS